MQARLGAWDLLLAGPARSRRAVSSGGIPEELRQGTPGAASAWCEAEGAKGAGRGGAWTGSRPRAPPVAPEEALSDGPRSCSWPTSLPCRHYAPVPGEWSCRGASWEPWAWVRRVPLPPAPASCLAGWAAGFCFCLTQILWPAFFCLPSSP